MTNLKFNKKWKIKLGKNEEKLEPSYTTGENKKRCTHWEWCSKVPHKLNSYPMSEQLIPHLHTCPKELKA
jgi:hypothetical protein